MDNDPLLLSPTATTATVHGAVDYRGFPASRSTSGGWTSALYITGVEAAERFAYFGVKTNLSTYLTGTLGEDTAAAAANANAWTGLSSMLPLLTGFVADKWVGRYNTIVAATLLNLLGYNMLTLSAIIPSLHPAKHSDGSPWPPTAFQNSFFFSSLYLIPLAQGAFKPCIQAFGADQFDENDPEERRSKSTFFNWWHFGIGGGSTFTILILVYIQDNISWGLGLGSPFVSMSMSLFVLPLGSKTYRCYATTGSSPFAKIGKAAESITAVEDEIERQQHSTAVSFSSNVL